MTEGNSIGVSRKGGGQEAVLLVLPVPEETYHGQEMEMYFPQYLLVAFVWLCDLLIVEMNL